MSICSCCYETNFSATSEIEIGHWWNNESYLAVVCSKKCKDELWNAKKNGTWMTRKPRAMFPTTYASKKRKELSAMTDTQFGDI